jgi:hypothetical protein
VCNAGLGALVLAATRDDSPGICLADFDRTAPARAPVDWVAEGLVDPVDAIQWRRR